MKVLHIRTVAGTGGGPDKTIFASCQSLREAGVGAEAFYILDAKAQYENFTRLADKYTVRLFQSFENSPISMRTLKKLHTVLQTENYDIVHSHDYKSNLLALLFRGHQGFKLVTTVHGYNRTSLREILYYAIDRAALRFSDAVITPSSELADTLARSGIARSKLHSIPNGIKIPEQVVRMKSGRTHKIHLLYLGRLSAEKDPANLIRALSLLKAEGLDVKLTLAGDGPEKRAIRKMIAEHNLSDSVHLAGYITNIGEQLQLADIFVNPSKTECMPNAILEAMVWQVPIVATNVGGVGEMLRDKIDGLLCERDNPVELAAKIKIMIQNPDLAKRLTQNAYRRVTEEFSFARHMEKTINIYRTLV